MRLKKILPALILTLALAFIMGINLPAFAEEGEMTASINGDNVRLRAESNTNSTILAVMKRGTQIVVTGQEDDWYVVRFNGMNGFVFGEFVLINTADDRPDYETEDGDGSQPGYINAASVRLRAAAGLNATILQTMNIWTPLTVTGRIGEWYTVTVGGVSGFVFADFVNIGERVVPAPIRGADGVEMVDWSEGKGIMRPGVRATVTDVATGISFEIRVMSSGSHADVEPLTAADTANLRRLSGGKFSWTPRACILTVNGRSIAVSINTMPHGGSTIRGNEFNGHFCIHFLNSRNHYNGRVDPGHQRQVRRAAGQ